MNFLSSKSKTSLAGDIDPFVQPLQQQKMTNELELFSILCAAFAVCGTITSLLTDCWQINSKGSVILSVRCRGLWQECVWDSFAKIWTCDHFSSFLDPHPASIVITRTLLITSTIMSSVAFLLLLLGFRHFQFCREAAKKNQLRQLSAGISFAVGLSSSAGIVQYCVYVFHMHQFEVSLKIPGFPSFEYGHSLWIAVGGALGAITTAVILSYNTCCKKTTMNNHTLRDENRPQEEQVLTTYV